MIKLNISRKLIGDRVILKDTHINIETGRFYVITGPSGVGKSTLLNILGLLDNDFSGNYYFRGEKLDIKNHRRCQHIRMNYFGFVFQNSLINGKQSIKRNILCSVTHSQHKHLEQLIPNILNSVGLSNLKENDAKMKASVISGGEMQRLALARALIKKPVLLFADEPTASLDLNNKYIVMNILQQYVNDGNTVIMVTHDLELIKNNMISVKLKND